MGAILDYFKNETGNLFRNKKNLVSLLVLGILILGIPLGVNLVRTQQIIKSRAAVDPIVFTGSNVSKKSDGTWVATKPQIQVQLTSPLGPAQSSIQTVKSKDSPLSFLPKGLVKTAYAEDNYCIAAGFHACNVGSVAGSCSKDGQSCTAYEAYQCNFGGQNYCDHSNCDSPCTGSSGGGGGTDNYCIAAGYHACNPGSAAGTCTKDGKTCTAYEHYACNFGGQNYCDNDKGCAEPCSGSGTSGGTSKGTIVCKATFKPSELGINSPGVCDRLHQYVADCNSSCPTKNFADPNKDCPPNTDQPNFINPDTSAWCYEFKDTDGISTNNNKCMQLRYIGTGSEASCASGEGSGGPAGCQGLDACSECVLLKRTDILPFYESNGWDTSCGNQANVVKNWCQIDPSGCQGVKTGQCASSCGGTSATSPSSSPASSPASSSAPAPAYTKQFRIAENPTDLASAPWRDYTIAVASNPLDYTFKDVTPGQKFIFVQFMDSTNKVTTAADCPKCQAQIELLGSGPTMTSCSLSFEDSKTILNLTGQNFGSEKGTVKSGDTNLEIKSWSDNSIQAVLQNAQTGQVLPITFTNTDEQTGTGQCGAISQLALGAKVFCRAPASHDTENVDMVLVDETGKKTRQTVKIDKDGVVQGLTQKLEVGKRYIVSLKAPKSLRRIARFTAGDGIVSIPNFILPIGDIFPLDVRDGAINPFDHAQLIREFIIAEDSCDRPGDFNRDCRVNSIDWACMRYDFGQVDDPEPTISSFVTSPSPNPTATSSSSLSPL
ncbi:MAG: IPT/TIG domain-containing protein [Candidatus Daviesbacteria bacterium]|nr:IPT/TIG domain-containing protein [Candidatus Daviesbacteria bacterium]